MFTTLWISNKFVQVSSDIKWSWSKPASFERNWVAGLDILDHPAADHRCGKKGKTKQDNKKSFAGREKSFVDNIPLAKPGKLVIKNVFSLWSEDQTQVTNIQMEIHHKGTIENLILWFAVTQYNFQLHFFLPSCVREGPASKQANKTCILKVFWKKN
jgi:hypothetical protein